MRQKVILTITLIGPECADRRQEGVAIHRLGLCVGETGGLLRRLNQRLGIEVETETHHLAQADEGALWETVGREAVDDG